MTQKPRYPSKATIARTVVAIGGALAGQNNLLAVHFLVANGHKEA